MNYNILYITNRIPLPIVDGQSRRTYNILKRIAASNSVTLITLVDNILDDGNIHRKIIEKICHKVVYVRQPQKAISLEMVARLLVSLISPWPYSIWRHFSVDLLKKIKKEMAQQEFDIVHCDNFPVSYTNRILKSNRTIFTDHDVSYLKVKRIGEGQVNLFKKLFYALEYKKMKRYERKIISNFNYTIVVSENDKSTLEKLNTKANLITIENGVEIDNFSVDPNKENDKTLLWVGGFKHLPNEEAIYHFLTNIYPTIKEKQKNVKLVLIGSSVTNRLIKLISKDATILHFDYVDRIVEYLEQATVFIAPILSGGGTKLKILEAMAASRAIVTTSVGCEGIEGRTNTHFIVADKDEDFADKTIELLNDKTKRNTLGRNAQKLVRQKYDYDDILKKLNRLHDQISKNNKLNNAGRRNILMNGQRII